MGEPEYYQLKNWRKWQHYKKRCPPWIRVYKDLLDDPLFMDMPESWRWRIVALGLLGSRNMDGRIPNQLSFVRQRIGAPKSFSFKPLVKMGWLVPASTTLAPCKQSATPEAESEADSSEAESEKKTTKKKKSDSTQKHIWGTDGRIRLDTVKREWLGITEDDLKMWRESYPAVAIELTLSQAMSWCIADPVKGKKSNYARFLSNWFKRTQDSGGTRGGATPGSTTPAKVWGNPRVLPPRKLIGDTSCRAMDVRACITKDDSGASFIQQQHVRDHDKPGHPFRPQEIRDPATDEWIPLEEWIAQAKKDHPNEIYDPEAGGWTNKDEWLPGAIDELR